MNAPSTERHILVVDDDQDVREACSDVLRQLGYRVTAVENGLRALERLRRSAPCPDLILLDLMMPEMNGWRLVEELQRSPELAAIPVIVFSACPRPAETVKDLPVAACLEKPPRLEQLLSTVERCLR